jgi:flagellar motor switch/type III secretory pathway protein FliN
MPANIHAFPFEGLPRVPAISAARSRAIARGLVGIDSARNVTARGLGRISIEVEAVEPAPWRPGGTQHPSPESAFTLLRADGSAACITVERFFALSLVRTALSAPTPPIIRPLSPSERGVLGAIVAGLLAGAGWGGIRVSLDRPRAVDDRERVSVNLTVRTSGTSGAVTLDVPLSWFPSRADTLPADSAIRLATALSVQLARTELTAAAYLAAEPGDALVFEGVSAPLDDVDQPWQCELVIGAWRAPAQFLANGDVRPAGEFVPGPDAGDGAMSDQNRSRDLPPEGAAILASAPVEIVAEIGRVVMRGDEVLGLVNGVVLSLGERRRDLVTLRVGGRTWAKGELVTIDDNLGVRITEVVGGR